MVREREPKDCHDCRAKPGELHMPGCDTEVCPDCGGQSISCECEGDFQHPRLLWTGIWPGVLECREFGWYSKFVKTEDPQQHQWAGRWKKCDKDDPEATEDLNRLAMEGVWDAEQGRFVRRA